jgi:exopolyphosphatase/guanosine-5'-triphosphate,3'-diphosphate pyrophosphatase
VRRACIDIGSNTTRLLVAECAADGLSEIHQERAFTRIGAALRDDGMIGAAKLAEVVGVVAGQLELARGFGAESVRCVATAAVRRARNGQELVARVAEGCDGLQVEVLSGEDEARLAFLGAAYDVSVGAGEELGVVDVGGGSSEVVVGRPPDQVLWWESLAVGSGEIADACLRSDPPSERELAAARVRVADALGDVAPPPVARAVAVGGSATSLTRLVGPVLDAGAFGRSLTLLASVPVAEVAARFALDVERVRLLPAGLLILEAISGRLRAPLVVGRGGIREGVLLEGYSRPAGADA